MALVPIIGDAAAAGRLVTKYGGNAVELGTKLGGDAAGAVASTAFRYTSGDRANLAVTSG